MWQCAHPTADLGTLQGPTMYINDNIVVCYYGVFTWHIRRFLCCIQLYIPLQCLFWHIGSSECCIKLYIPLHCVLLTHWKLSMLYTAVYPTTVCFTDTLEAFYVVYSCISHCSVVYWHIGSSLYSIIIIIIIIRQPLCPVVGRRPQHAVSKLPCLVLSSAISHHWLTIEGFQQGWCPTG